MKILVVTVHFEVTGGRYITEAFQRLGIEVKHVGQFAMLQQAWGVTVTPGHAWIPDEVNPDQWKPDLIILADTLVRDWQPPGDWQDIPIIYWSQDNHVRNVRRDGIAHYFLAHKRGQAQPVQYDDETWLPCAFDPSHFTPSTIPFDKRQYDVCLVGVMYPQRLALLESLKRAGITVLAATGLIYQDYARAYQNSRISLCVSANRDVGQRVFETSAMGCHVLTDVLDDLVDPEANAYLGLAGFSVYQTHSDCVDSVKRLLTVDRIACIAATQAMQRMVWSMHTWEHRCHTVLSWFQRYRAQKVT